MIRTATIDDLPEIVAIYNEAIVAGGSTGDRTPFNVEERLEWFHAHDPNEYPVYVLIDNSRILGWASLSAYRRGRASLSRTAEITYYVSFSAHRKGVGTRLIQHALTEAPKLGVRVLFGILFESNAGSIALLKKFGFEQWAFLPDVAEVDGQLMNHVYYGRKVDPLAK